MAEKETALAAEMAEACKELPDNLRDYAQGMVHGMKLACGKTAPEREEQ